MILSYAMLLTCVSGALVAAAPSQPPGSAVEARNGPGADTVAPRGRVLGGLGTALNDITESLLNRPRPKGGKEKGGGSSLPNKPQGEKEKGGGARAIGSSKPKGGKEKGGGVRPIGSSLPNKPKGKKEKGGGARAIGSSKPKGGKEKGGKTKTKKEKP